MLWRFLPATGCLPALGVVSPFSVSGEALIGELRSLAAAAALPDCWATPSMGEDWKNNGEEDGTCELAARAAPRGVVCAAFCEFRLPLLVDAEGLLCGCCCWARVGVDVAELRAERPPRPEEGDDIAN